MTMMSDVPVFYDCEASCIGGLPIEIGWGGVVWGGMRGRLGRAWTWQGRGLGNGRAEGLQREGKHSAVMRKARMYMCAMQALCGTTLPSASGRSAFCVAAGFKDAPNRFC